MTNFSAIDSLELLQWKEEEVRRCESHNIFTKRAQQLRRESVPPHQLLQEGSPRGGGFAKRIASYVNETAK
jgi:hypothetical protein